MLGRHTTSNRGIALATSLLMAGAAQAALQARDLDGNSVTDAYYDTDRDITWLRNTNVNGDMQWQAAVTWADGLSFGGFDDWRLPASDFCGDGFGCTGSEMGHLWYTELGNTAGALTQIGGFNLEPFWYWSGQSGGSAAIAFNMANGRQAFQLTSSANYFYAMAVRDGDVPAIPEPGTYALFSVGLLGTLLTLRRQRPAAR